LASSTGISFSSDGNGVAYGLDENNNPLWVAVGIDSNGQECILFSENGKHWQVSTGISFSGTGNGVASNLLNPALKGSPAAPPFPS